MDECRSNTVVVDFSVLPKCPGAAAVHKFLTKELCLDQRLATCIQMHNIRNMLYIEMVTREAAEELVTNRNYKHVMEVDNIAFKIPLYIEAEAIDVRVHDLPNQMSNKVIWEQMLQYGHIFSLRSERWKHYYPGMLNGVRVLRMKLSRPIPSYINIANKQTLITYQNQMRTCRHCEGPAHPKLRCSEVTEHDKLADSQSETTNKPTANKKTASKASTSFAVTSNVTPAPADEETFHPNSSQEQLRPTQDHHQNGKQTRQWAPSPDSSPEFHGFPETANLQSTTAKHTDTTKTKRQLSAESSDGTGSETNETVNSVMKPHLKKKK